MADVEVSGEVDQGYEPVREAFVRNFLEHGDIGASLAVYSGGRRVVDLAGGVADLSRGQAYTADTLQVVFSSTKGAVAACLNLLVSLGMFKGPAQTNRTA